MLLLEGATLVHEMIMVATFVHAVASPIKRKLRLAPSANLGPSVVLLFEVASFAHLVSIKSYQANQLASNVFQATAVKVPITSGSIL